MHLHFIYEIAWDFTWLPVGFIQRYVMFVHTQSNLELSSHLCVVKADK